MEVYKDEPPEDLPKQGDERRLALVARVALADIIGDSNTGAPDRLVKEGRFARWPQKPEWMRLIMTLDDRINLTVYHTPEDPVPVPPSEEGGRPETTDFHARLFVANGSYLEHREVIDAALTPWFDIVPLPEGQAANPR